MSMRIDILTALPDIVTGPLEQSILRRASAKGLLEVAVHDLRQYATGKHRQIDDYPYGGGAGMVLKPEPIFACIEELRGPADGEDPGSSGGVPGATTPEEAGPMRGLAAIDEVIYLSPDGETLTQSMANELSLKRRLVLLAGHYKGVDQRVRDVLVTREVSIGDYVLSGGELAALVLVDAVARLLPGVLGDATSALNDSFQDGLLDAPAYTRPATFRGMEVPGVLRSGDHDRIAEWRQEQRRQKTRARRPDLL